jgi:hypothetical protein
MAAQQAETTQQVAHERAEQAEQAKQERTRRARQAERERVNQDRAKAREAYEGLTKAELSDQLAALGLPNPAMSTTLSTDSSKRTTIDGRASGRCSVGVLDVLDPASVHSAWRMLPRGTDRLKPSWKAACDALRRSW